MQQVERAHNLHVVRNLQVLTVYRLLVVHVCFQSYGIAAKIVGPINSAKFCAFRYEAAACNVLKFYSVIRLHDFLLLFINNSCK